MLHIRRNTNGEIVYGFSQTKIKYNDQQTSCQAPVPKLPVSPHKKRIDFDTWKANNLYYIEHVTEHFIEGLISFLNDNPHYNCSVNQNEFETKLSQLLYKKSHNSYKSYPYLS